MADSFPPEATTVEQSEERTSDSLLTIKEKGQGHCECRQRGAAVGGGIFCTSACKVTV